MSSVATLQNDEEYGKKLTDLTKTLKIDISEKIMTVEDIFGQALNHQVIKNVYINSLRR